jgi:hypothetical protein
LEKARAASQFARQSSELMPMSSSSMNLENNNNNQTNILTTSTDYNENLFLKPTKRFKNILSNNNNNNNN